MARTHNEVFALVAVLVGVAPGCAGMTAADAVADADVTEAADAAREGDAGEAADAAGSEMFDEAAADPGVWTWFPIDGAYCRDGSTAGLGLRVRPGSRGLVVFMHGGGNCFNRASCRLNRSSFDEVDFVDWTRQMGDRHIFTPNNAMNPVRDWNAAFISYCTGDIHGGTRTGVDVPGGPANQMFVGHENMMLMTDLLSDYFRDLDHVLLVGSSAGGFGTALNYPYVHEAFAPARVTLLDDSGPFLPNDEAFAPCLQRKIRDLWGLDDVISSDCTECFAPSGDGLSNLFAYLGTTYPDDRFGLLSTTGDVIIRTFLGFGRNHCNPIVALPVTVGVYTAGLYELRSGLPANWATYYAGGPLHAILALFPVLSVDGVTLRSWVSDLVAGTVSHVAPP